MCTCCVVRDHPLPRFAAGNASNAPKAAVPLELPNGSLESAGKASLAKASLKGLSLDGGVLDVGPVGKAASNAAAVAGPAPLDGGAVAVVGAAAVGNPPMLLPDPARAAGNAAKLFAVAEALFERTGAVLAALDGFTAVVSGRFDAADGGVCPPARGASDGLGTGTTGGARAGVEADARAGAGGGAEVTAPRALATFVASALRRSTSASRCALACVSTCRCCSNFALADASAGSSRFALSCAAAAAFWASVTELWSIERMDSSMSASVRARWASPAEASVAP